MSKRIRRVQFLPKLLNRRPHPHHRNACASILREQARLDELAPGDDLVERRLEADDRWGRTLAACVSINPTSCRPAGQAKQSVDLSHPVDGTLKKVRYRRRAHAPSLWVSRHLVGIEQTFAAGSDGNHPCVSSVIETHWLHDVRGQRPNDASSCLGPEDRGRLSIDLQLHDAPQLRQALDVLRPVECGGHGGQVADGGDVRLEAVPEVLLAGGATQRDKPARDAGGRRMTLSSPNGVANARIDSSLSDCSVT